MKIDEFVELTNKFKKNETKFYILWLIFFFTVLIGNVFIADYLESLFKNKSTLTLIYLIFLLGFLFLNLFYLFYRIYKQPKKYGLVCKNCNKSFQQRIFKIVIATKNCPFCGKKVIDE